MQGLSADESALIEEKAHIVEKNLDLLRLGIEEAQVNYSGYLSYLLQSQFIFK